MTDPSGPYLVTVRVTAEEARAIKWTMPIETISCLGSRLSMDDFGISARPVSLISVMANHPHGELVAERESDRSMGPPPHATATQ